ncbi:hypothetical protein [Nostoc edaphicum]|nr:hypothetical protein [Nostoc edaphicum]
MPVAAISLPTGLELPAAIADFDTYIDELPRCSIQMFWRIMPCQR